MRNFLLVDYVAMLLMVVLWLGADSIVAWVVCL